MDNFNLNKFDEEIENLEEMRNNFKKEIERLTIDIGKLEKERFIKENDIKKIEEDNLLNIQKNENLIKENEILINKNNSLISQNKDLMNKNNLLKKNQEENIETIEKDIKAKKEVIEENEKLIKENFIYLETLLEKKEKEKKGEIDTTEETIITKDLVIAMEIKKKGAEFFKNKEYKNAIDKFEEALLYTPEAEISLITILNSNIGICLMKLEDFEEALFFLNRALAENPNFIKAQVNRAECNYQLKKYEPCLNDYDDLLKKNSKFINFNKYNQIKKLQQEEFELKKNEVMGQMKDMGNKFLGMFGMSVDNFKLNDNNNGGYNISFQQ